MTTDTKEFILNWERKLIEIKNDDLGSLFEKFTTIYTIYNRLYNEAYAQAKQKDAKLNINGDYKKAVIFVNEYISSDIIIQVLEDQNLIIEVDDIARLIEEKVFYINLRNGTPELEMDDQLRNNLLSDDKEIKAKAILTTIYKVRCNLVHGHKNFEEYQRLLVEPLLSIIVTIVGLLKVKLIK